MTWLAADAEEVVANTEGHHLPLALCEAVVTKRHLVRALVKILCDIEESGSSALEGGM